MLQGEIINRASKETKGWQFIDKKYLTFFRRAPLHGNCRHDRATASSVRHACSKATFCTTASLPSLSECRHERLLERGRIFFFLLETWKREKDGDAGYLWCAVRSPNKRSRRLTAAHADLEREIPAVKKLQESEKFEKKTGEDKPLFECDKKKDRKELVMTRWQRKLAEQELFFTVNCFKQRSINC